MQMDTPLISVILPIYNVEEYLSDCMESLLRQSWRNMEFVLVDDGSGEKCAAACDEWKRRDPRVVVWHKRNGGVSDARNYGVEKAGGTFLTFVDPDDYVSPDYVEYLYSLIRKYDTKMSVCQHQVVYPGAGVHSFGSHGDEVLSDRECIRRMLYHDVIDTSTWAKLYHRSLFEGIAYPKGRLFEDIATTYRLMLASGRIAVGYEAKYSYTVRRRTDSIVNSAFHAGKLDLLEMTDAMAEDVTARYPELKQAAVRRQVYARFSTLNQMLEFDQPALKREMMDYINKHRFQILRDKNAPGRDKAAILALALGLRAYRCLWAMYSSRQAKSRS